MVDPLYLVVACTLLGVAFAWILAPFLFRGGRCRPRLRKPGLRPEGTMETTWYLDERSHTGDLVFMDSHVALMLMHPASGEPLMVEADDEGGMQITPARERLAGFVGKELFVLRIVRPLSASQVLNTKLPDADMDCSQFAMFVLSRLGVLDGRWMLATPRTLATAASCSGKYRGPFVLE